MPGPATAQPEADGPPVAKKLKTSDGAEISEDWEAVERSGETAVNGPQATDDDDAVVVEKTS